MLMRENHIYIVPDEMDEPCTYVRYRKNQVWVVYAIRRDTKEIIDFNIGRRTNNTLKLS